MFNFRCTQPEDVCGVFFLSQLSGGGAKKKNPLPLLNFDLSDAERIIQVQFACIC